MRVLLQLQTINAQNTQNPDSFRKTTEPLINAKGQILPAVAMGDVINYHMC